MGLKAYTGDGWLISRMDDLVNWGRKNSLWPLPYGTACCGIEMMATMASGFDIARFGAERPSFSPRQADVMIVAGTIVKKMAPVIRKVYEQMADPKWVLAMGACATSGGIFDTYSTLQGVDLVIPVDVFIPGCPPRPEGLLYGLMELQKKIGAERPVSGPVK